LVLPLPAAAQTLPVDLDGPWLVSIGRKDAGAAVLFFGVPTGGDFTVDGGGMSLALGEFFLVSPGQTLQRDSAGRISGTLAIESVVGAPLGSIPVENGKVKGDFLKFKFPGMLEPLGALPLPIVQKGTRPPLSFPVLSGRSTRGRVGGGGTKSRNYVITVQEDALGPPLYTFDGIGPVKIDGLETPGVAMSGRFLLDAKGRLFGIFISPQFGSGVVEGKLKPGETVPKLKLKVTADRRFRVKADLDRAVSPILRVTPSGTFDLGSVQVGGTSELIVTVENAGTGLLSGQATIAPDDRGFAFVDGAAEAAAIDYGPLAEGASTELRLRFRPTDSGARDATVTFTGGGGTTRTVRGTGADLLVTPSELDFGDVEVGANGDLTFTVANRGSSQIQGEATFSSPTDDFVFRVGGSSVDSASYDLAVGEEATITVRFAPDSAGPKSAEVAFSGGIGATRPVRGTGVEPPAP
jgi:hypothetical protein